VSESAVCPDTIFFEGDEDNKLGDSEDGVDEELGWAWFACCDK
jgi:hypothetical protein